jgi:hypothetical protein
MRTGPADAFDSICRLEQPRAQHLPMSARERLTRLNQPAWSGTRSLGLDTGIRGSRWPRWSYPLSWCVTQDLALANADLRPSGV